MNRFFVASLAVPAVLASEVCAQSSLDYQPTLRPVSVSQNLQLGAGAPYEGLTLYQPMFDTTARLVDTAGNVVKSFPGMSNPGVSVYLFPNGNLLRTAVIGAGPGGGGGGRIEEVDEDGNIIWRFDLANSEFLHHHDVEQLPNGNVVMIVWEYLTIAEAVAAGRNPALTVGARFSPDKVIEIQPDGAGGADVVWEWRVLDHLIQDFDPTQDNFGVVGDHPELVDVNFPPNPTDDWNHCNGIDYNPELDQIVLSVNLFDEMWVIDHSTTTAEAAGHTGGNSGRGGDILYRWGNPIAYRAGTVADRRLFRQHDVQWIDAGRPGEGNFLVFNNGLGRPEGTFSTVDEWVPPVDAMGNYSLTPGSAFGPADPIWSYRAPNPTDFFSNIVSGCERQPNGNTLIINGLAGMFFEVTQDMDVVWQYVNPFGAPTWVFKARRYDFACGTVPFCVAAPNSAGAGAEIDSSGSTSLASNDLSLEVSGAPASVSALFFYGTSQVQTPFGDGFRCAGGMTSRLQPPTTADATGNVSRAVDLGSLPSGGLVTGETLNFQLWFRDPMGASFAGFNTSNGLAVTFCD